MFTKDFYNSRQVEKNLTGCDITFASDLPQAAGMSSSSAFMITIYFAIAGVKDLESHPKFKKNIQKEIDFTSDYSFVIGASGVQAEKTSNAIGQ